MTAPLVARKQKITDNAPGGLQDSFWIVNAGIKIGPADGRYEFAFLGRNLLDEYFMTQAFAWTAASNPEQYTAFWNRPRELVLQGTYRF